MQDTKLLFLEQEAAQADSTSELQGLRVQDTAGTVLGEVTAVIDGLDIACCYLHVGGQPVHLDNNAFWVPMSSVLKISDNYIEIETPAPKGPQGGLL